MKKALSYQFKDNLGMNIVGLSGFGDWEDGDLQKAEQLAKEQALERFDKGLKDGLKGKALILETLVNPLSYKCLDRDITPITDTFFDKVCDDMKRDYNPKSMKKIFDSIAPTSSVENTYDEFVKAYNEYIDEINAEYDIKLSNINKDDTKNKLSSGITWYKYISNLFEKVFSQAKKDFAKLLENQYDDQKLREAISTLIDETNSAILLNELNDKENSPYSIAPEIDSPTLYPSIYLMYGLALNAIDGEKVSEQKFDAISKAKKKISNMSTGVKVGIGLAGLGVCVGLVYYLTKPKTNYPPQNYPPQNYPPQNYPNRYPR